MAVKVNGSEYSAPILVTTQLYPQISASSPSATPGSRVDRLSVCSPTGGLYQDGATPNRLHQVRPSGAPGCYPLMSDTTASWAASMNAR